MGLEVFLVLVRRVLVHPKSRDSLGPLDRKAGVGSTQSGSLPSFLLTNLLHFRGQGGKFNFPNMYALTNYFIQRIIGP